MSQICMSFCRSQNKMVEGTQSMCFRANVPVYFNAFQYSVASATECNVLK